jgi:hypothetical protein
MKDQTTYHQDDQLLFQNYFVAFLDVLGQRRGLREIKDLPTNDREKGDFIKKLQDTFGKVDALRGGFRNYFETAESQPPDTSLVPPEYRDEFVASQKSEAYFYGFSDSIIIAVPLMSKDENCTAMNGVFSTLVATGGISLIALSTKVALRGGLDVGVAAQIEGKEIYGPALERAYFLESNLAEYPRFLVGKELFTYLHWVENQQCRTRQGVIAKNLAKFCKEMIVQDTDGRPMLDFLGERAREAADNSIDAEVVRSARDFVIAQYKACLDNENHKLSSRYFRLLKYINSRAKRWGVELDG